MPAYKYFIRKYSCGVDKNNIKLNIQCSFFILGCFQIQKGFLATIKYDFQFQRISYSKLTELILFF